MCGPSKQQELTAGQQASLSSTLQANYNENFGKQSAILSNMMKIFTPISEAGPDQQGFGANELAALNTTAGEGVGANYAKASQALNNTLAARGGGSEVLPTGARAALKGSLASAAANELSRQQLGITEANYAQGRQNWSQANAGLLALSGQYNPNAVAGEATGANQAAFGEASKIQEMKNQKTADIIGGITSLGMDAATFGVGAMGGGGFQGGLTALTGGQHG